MEILNLLSLSEKLEIAEKMYLRGYSCRRIARELRIPSIGKVSKFLKERGHTIIARVGNSGYDRQALFEKLEVIWLERGGSIKKLCQEHHTTPVSFTAFLRSKGHTVKPHRNSTNLELKIQKLSQAEFLFQNGSTVAEVARAVKINNAVIADYLKSKGNDTSRSWRIFLVNENIFKCIDTEEKAYWLGFLYADAAIAYDGIRYVVELTLKEDDYNHLVKFKEFIQTDAHIKKKIIKGKHGKEYVAYRIGIHNKTLVEDLVDKGCGPNKSLTLLFPGYNIVPKELMRHFIRGYIDGDGTIYLPKKASKGKPQATVSFIGTQHFLLGVRKELNLSDTKMFPQGQAWRSSHGGNYKVGDLLNQIYQDTTIYLDRKYELNKKFFEEY
jgi:predicted transcriptional regulator